MQDNFRRSAIELALLSTIALSSSAVQAQTAKPTPGSSAGSNAPDAMSKPPAKTDPGVTSEPAPSSTPPASTTAKPAKINVNTATADDLVKAGLDVSTAKLIIQGQPYKSADQILELKGLTPESKDVLNRNIGVFTTSSDQ